MPSTSEAKPNLVAIKDVRPCRCCQLTVTFQFAINRITHSAATIWPGQATDGAPVRRGRSHSSPEGSAFLSPDVRRRLPDLRGRSPIAIETASRVGRL